MPVYTDKDVGVISEELARWLDKHQAQYRAVCGLSRASRHPSYDVYGVI